jgi:hypothetical protein
VITPAAAAAPAAHIAAAAGATSRQKPDITEA